MLNVLFSDKDGYQNKYALKRRRQEIISDRREYRSVTVHVAFVNFAIRFCPWSGLCLSVFLSSHNSRIIFVMLSNTL